MTPPPQAIAGLGAGAGEHWRGEGAQPGEPLWCSASTAQRAESRREGPRAPAGGAAHLPTLRPTPPGGDRDPGAEQAGGPGTGQSSAGSRTSHSAAGGWLSRGGTYGIVGARSPCSATSPGCKLTFLCAQAAAPGTPGYPAQCWAEEGRRKEAKFSQPLSSCSPPALHSLVSRRPSGSPLRALACLGSVPVTGAFPAWQKTFQRITGCLLPPPGAGEGHLN